MANLKKNMKEKHRWPGGLIAYEIDDSISDHQRASILEGIETVSDLTLARFVEKNDDDRYWIRFKEDPERTTPCGSGAIGRKPKNRNEGQLIKLKDGRCSEESVAHELGHHLGLVHEHQRPDRLQYIRLYEGRLKMEHPDFIEDNITNEAGQPFGAYDYDSIMHYRAYVSSREIPYRLRGMHKPGYNVACFYCVGGKFFSLMFRTSESTVTVFEIRPNGRLVLESDTANGYEGPREILPTWTNESTGEEIVGRSGWTHADTFMLDNQMYFIRLNGATGETEVWSIGEDGAPESYKDGITLTDETETWQWRSFSHYGGDAVGASSKRFYFLSAPDDSGMQLLRYRVFSSGGYFKTVVYDHFLTGGYTGIYTYFYQVGGSETLRHLLIDRQLKKIARCSPEETTGEVDITHTFEDFHDTQGISWDHADFILASEYGVVHMVTYDSTIGRLDLYAIIASNSLTVQSLDTLSESESAGYDLVYLYNANGNRALLLIKSAMSCPAAAWDMTANAFGGRFVNKPPTMERIAPRPESNRYVFRDDFPSVGDREAIDTLIGGNLEIRTAEQPDLFERTGVLYLEGKITDVLAWTEDEHSELMVHPLTRRYLWAGNGKEGTQYLIELDRNGKPKGRWQALENFPKWHTAAVYQANNGQRFALFRGKNSSILRRHRIVDARIDPNPLDEPRMKRWRTITPFTVDDVVYVAFVRHSDGYLQIRKIDDDGGFSSVHFNGDVKKGLTCVCHLAYGNQHYLLFAGSRNKPELRQFSPDTGLATQSLDVAALVSGKWDDAVLLGDGSAALYDAKKGEIQIHSAETFLDNVTPIVRMVGKKWLGIRAFALDTGTRVVQFKNGWNWDGGV